MVLPRKIWCEVSAFQVFPENADLSPFKRVKFGIDPTFPRLHLGHLVPLRLAKKMMLDGHHLTIVLGTFTAQLGDPSGRDSTRPILAEAEVEANAKSILSQIFNILGEENIALYENIPGKWTLCKNGWLHNQMTLPTFMKQVAKFTLSHMTSRNAFQDRIDNKQSIGMHELLVPICQGWDSVALKSEIEIGGQDQLFNFQIARQLQEANGQKPQSCIMMPIINGTDGRKMSKSLGNCIFFDDDPNDVFGKVMCISDAVMEEWFPLFVDFTVEDDVHPMDKKKILAVEIVKQLHTSDVAEAAQENFYKTVQNKELPTDISTLPASSLLNAVVACCNISKTAARQRLREGAVKVDGVKTFDEQFVLSAGQTVQCGRRDFARIV